MNTVVAPTRADTARLPIMLAELRLPTIRRLWPELAEQSNREGWPAERFLGVLLEQGAAEEGLRALQPTLAGCAQLPPDIQALVRLVEGELLSGAGRHAEAIGPLMAAESLVAPRWVHSAALAEIRGRLADAQAAAPRVDAQRPPTTTMAR